ncbi:MAG: hypothetical protein FWC16_05930 [Defluviitaleaceae bacterium]|nr:hypothetical protein [Defluviitaleaceae bacterium]MCL2274447.1 hypothetical protein [Defluviitaleaceae bacterium]
MHHWRVNFTKCQTKLKHSVIIRAGTLFGLCEDEAEALANKSGLSLCKDESFGEMLRKLVHEYPQSKRHLCEASMVSERMFRYMKEGQHLKKEPVLALAISLGADLENIQTLLKKAGYILSASLPNDVVVMWILKNETNVNLVLRINEELDELGLPLLMTNEK